MTAARECQLLEAANLLLNARRTLTPINNLPAELIPTSPEETVFIQDRIAEAFGPVGGWKVGAGSLEATPSCGPMPQAWIAATGASLPAANHRFRGLEAEIAFLLRSDLPPRATPYSDEEVYAAVESCHPAIEVLESGLANVLDPNIIKTRDADLQMNGGFVYGPATPDWHAIDWSKEHVMLAIDGVVRVDRTGSNTSGNLLRLLPWLANAGAARTGGLRAGQWITTGSWTGNTFATAGETADAHFASAGSVGLRFE